VAATIDGDDVLSRWVKQIARKVCASQTEAGRLDRLSLYYWQLRERPRDRLRYVWRTMITPRDDHYKMIRLPDALFGGYVVVKLVHDYLLFPPWKVAKGLWRRRAAAS